MDTPAVNNVGNPTAPKPKPIASSSRSGSEASSSTPPAGDTVSLSKKGQDLAQLDNAAQSTTESVNNEQRKFLVTENHDVVLKVIDPQTQEVVKSVPSEEQLELRDAIRNELNNI